MAEPASALLALGIASNAISVVDFASKVTKATYLVVSSASNVSEENAAIEELAHDYERLSLQAPRESGRPLTAEEEHVEELSEKDKVASKNLLDLLENFKLDESKRGFKRLMDGGKKMTKSIMAKNKIDAERRCLSDLNGQLSLALIKLLSTRQIAHFQRLQHHVEEKGVECISAILSAKGLLREMSKRTQQHVKLAETRQRELLNQIAADVSAVMLGIHGQAVAIQDLAKSEEESKKAKPTIESLKYDNMFARWEAGIEASFGKTFWWILDRPGVFRSWLRNENGIFWITGKAGSGKSTLMKFIGQSNTTRRMLTHWTGKDNCLVVVKVAFWFPGSPLQKSLLGLMRSVMFQILDQIPKLAPLAFPDRLESEQSSEKRTGPWSYGELLDALKTIGTLEGYKFCFFIDGLDEFQDGNGMHTDLVNVLGDLALCPNIKLCLSSRPWHVFESRFGQLHSTLTLEDLTRDDIQDYIHGKLEDALREQDQVHSIALEISKRAEGVFLWVVLAVGALREEFENTGDAEFMRERLNEFPPGLDDFFNLIISRIPQRYRSYTARALHMACTGSKTPFGSTMPLFWLIRHMTHKDFAVKMEIMHCNREEFIKMAHTTQRLLKAWTKDLLQVPQLRPGLGSSWESDVLLQFRKLRVECLHRTLYDFLAQQHMRELILKDVPSHWHEEAFNGRLRLASAKIGYEVVDVPHPSSQCEGIIEDSRSLVTMPDCPEKEELIFEFNRVAGEHARKFCDPECGYPPDFFERLWTIEGLGGQRLHPKQSPPSRSHRPTPMVKDFANTNFPSTLTVPAEKDPVPGLNQLESALGLSLRQGLRTEGIDVEFVKVALEAGSNPLQGSRDTALTIWQRFLLRLYPGQLSTNLIASIGSQVKSLAVLDDTACVSSKTWEIAKLMLDHGATLRTRICEDPLCNLFRIARNRHAAECFEAQPEAQPHWTITAVDILRTAIPTEDQVELEEMIQASIPDVKTAATA